MAIEETSESRVSYREYSSTDRDECLGVFRSNMPRFFRDHEQPDFEEFIDSGECPYFVIEHAGTIVGCGGYGVRTGSDHADLCWGMVDQSRHGQRLGEFLLLLRLSEIIQDPGIKAVRLGTSQLTDGFFQRYGFAVCDRKVNAIAEGLDEVEMLLELNEETRSRVGEFWHATLNQRTESF